MPPRERSIRVEAVVLRHTDWGEADRLLWLYTRDLGKVRAVGKGVRKPRSRKAGHLEPFTRVSLQLARGREILIITQAETIDAYLALREDLLRIGYAAYVVELLDRFTFEEEENRSLYRLMVDTLSRLNSAPSKNTDDLALAVHYYEIRLLDLLGFRPHLFECARCSAEIQPEDQFFSAADGGVLCPGCGTGDPAARPISMPALKVLRHLQRSPYTEATRVHLAPGLDREIETIMHSYLTYVLERGLNSPAFLRQVKNPGLSER
jgi:DNA repair protein RecO (recombination protein O)